MGLWKAIMSGLLRLNCGVLFVHRYLSWEVCMDLMRLLLIEIELHCKDQNIHPYI